MIEQLFIWLQEVGSSPDSPLVYAFLFASATIEYIFPPYPGDMVTAFGGVLVSTYQWNLAGVFTASFLGSFLGGLMAYALGRRWSHGKALASSSAPQKLAGAVAHVQQHATLYLLLNRFIPGVRPFIFVAAGIAGVSTKKTLLLSAIGTLLWNTLLMFAGSIAGQNLAQIEQWLKQYTYVAIAIIIVAALVYVVMRIIRSRH